MQRILNIALDFYTPGSIGFCSCLILAYEQKLITFEETDNVQLQIMKYIDELSPEGSHAFLKDALMDAGLPYDWEDRLNIYMDWENRPKPWLKK